MEENLLGTAVGNIRIVELLAKGGTGEVYVGRDQQLDRKVALKAIRPRYRLDQEAKARLLREARILSRLEHPNICRIYDYLTAADRDFLVLELIPGKNLRQILHEDLDGVLKMKIALELAGVLEAAHGQGVIHRDLKPENVMLTPGGQVKVLDFGLARAQEGDLTATLSGPELGSYEAAGGDGAGRVREDVRTRLGRVLGTVGYMSPEQARGEPMTSASDMYSLGLLLQELFTGRRPFEQAASPREQLLRAANAETLPVVDVDADLAALIERLKAVTPSARPSASEAAERLRWIRDKPRRARRRRLTWMVGVLLALTVAVMALQSVRISREAERANREAEAARQVTDFLVGLFEVSDPGRTRGTTLTARELLDYGAVKARRALDDPLIRARVMHTIGDSYRRLGLHPEATSLLEEALALRRELLGEGHLEVADSEHALAYLYWRQGEYARAEPLYARAIAIREKLLGAGHPKLAASLNGLGIIRWAQGDYAAAEPLYLRALDIRRQALGAYHPDVAASLDNLAILYKDQGRAADAEPLYRRSLELRERTLGADHPDVATSLSNLGEFYREQDRYREAEPLLRRAVAIWESTLGGDHPSLAVGLNNLADTLAAAGEREEAEPVYRRALAIMEKALGPDHVYVGYALRGLGRLHAAAGEPAVAEPVLLRSLKILEGSLGAEHRDVGWCWKDLAGVSADLGKAADAAAARARAAAILERDLPADDPALVALRQSGPGS